MYLGCVKVSVCMDIVAQTPVCTGNSMWRCYRRGLCLPGEGSEKDKTLD